MPAALSTSDRHVDESALLREHAEQRALRSPARSRLFRRVRLGRLLPRPTERPWRCPPFRTRRTSRSGRRPTRPRGSRRHWRFAPPIFTSCSCAMPALSTTNTLNVSPSGTTASDGTTMARATCDDGDRPEHRFADPQRPSRRRRANADLDAASRRVDRAREPRRRRRTERLAAAGLPRAERRRACPTERALHRWA